MSEWLKEHDWKSVNAPEHAPQGRTSLPLNGQSLFTVCVPLVIVQWTVPPGMMVTLEGLKLVPLAVTVAVLAPPAATTTVPTIPMLT